MWISKVFKFDPLQLAHVTHRRFDELRISEATQFPDRQWRFIIVWFGNWLWVLFTIQLLLLGVPHLKQNLFIWI